MKILSGRNVNDIYPAARSLIASEGIPQDSRAGRVLALPYPVCTVYEKPLERVLFDPKRDQNPFFTCFEGIWMLAGQDDARMLDHFIKDFSSRFAEQDGRVHGAYGKRWLWHFQRPTGLSEVTTPINQLKECIRLLRINPDDRQAVIQMWDAEVDLGVSGLNDRPCLSGETILWSPEYDLTIENVAQLFARKVVDRWPIYTVDPVTCEQRISWASNVWKSGTKKVLKITFDDGSVVRATPDHRFFKRRRVITKNEEIEAKDLKPGMRVIATRRFTGKKGHEMIKLRLGENTHFQNVKPTHRLYAELLWGSIPEGFQVHHKNENKVWNSECNLEVMSNSEHSRIHRLGDKNPMRRMPKEQREVKGRNHSSTLKNSWAQLTPEERKRRARGYNKPDNHIVVSVEEDEVCDVYDFTVPGTHTAIVGTGVLSHNCNTQIYLRIVNGALDLTTTSRSHDMIFGAVGANVVHFTMLQEYLAAGIGCEVGKFYQFSNNYHVYEDVWNKTHNPLMKSSNEENCTNHYHEQHKDRDIFPDGVVAPYPIITNFKEFDRDVAVFLEGDWLSPSKTYVNPWFTDVLRPVVAAGLLWRQGRKDDAYEAASACEASDWRLACQQWMERRMNGRTK